MSELLCGWVRDDEASEAYAASLAQPTVKAAAPHLDGAGAGKTALLYEAARKLWKRDLDDGPQLIGDCVSWGWARAVDLCAIIRVLAGQPEGYEWEDRACTEAIYALSRVEVGGRRIRGDGSNGSWAARAVERFGTRSRRDLGAYDPRRARSWGDSGLPDELEPEALRHACEQVVPVRTFAEARDLIAGGACCVPVCSDIGFETGGRLTVRRDGQGFSRPVGAWPHCMTFIASRDDSRPGLLCMNQWPAESCTGPKGEFDIPAQSWWVDADVCDRMLREGDSYAPSGFKGYPALTFDFIF